MSERTIGTVPLEKLLAEASDDLDRLSRATDAEGVTAADLAKAKGWSIEHSRQRIRRLVEAGTWKRVGSRSSGGRGRELVYLPVGSQNAKGKGKR